MKTTSRLIFSVILAILFACLPVIVGSKPQASVLAQDEVESDGLVKIEGQDQEPPAEIDNTTQGEIFTVGFGTFRCDYTTIEAALADSAVSDGDTLHLKGGYTFSEHGLTIDKDLVIEGGHEVCGGNTEPSTINAGSLGFGLQAQSATVTLKNLIITGGYSANGGGLGAVSLSMVTLDNTKIDNNHATNTGGGIYIGVGSTVTLTNNSDITNNAATNDGGGARVWGKLIANDGNSSVYDNQAAYGAGLSVPGGEVDFNGSHISDNVASSFGGGIHVYDEGVVNVGWSSNIMRNSATSGGGIFAENSSVELNGATVHSNDASSAGGGIFLAENSVLTASNSRIGYIFENPSLGKNTSAVGAGLYVDAGATATFSGEIVNNHATNNGGGVFAYFGTVNFTDTLIKGNTSGADGGALYLSDSSMNAENTQFVYNLAAQHGGAISADYSILNISANLASVTLATTAKAGSEMLIGSSIQTTTCNPFEEECSAFNGNVADWDDSLSGSGGAIYLNESTLDMSQTHLHDNKAYNGGAIYQTGSTSGSTISNSLIHHNTVTIANGAGIRMENGTFHLMHVTITDNNGGASFSGRATSVFNSIAWENGYVGFTLEPLTFLCNIDNGAAAGPVLNPLFVAPGDTRNYHLQPESPAVDACATGSGVDLENRTRPIGAGYDMGVFESVGFPIYLPLILR